MGIECGFGDDAVWFCRKNPKTVVTQHAPGTGFKRCPTCGDEGFSLQIAALPMPKLIKTENGSCECARRNRLCPHDTSPVQLSMNVQE